MYPDEPMEDAPSNPIDSAPETPQESTDQSQIVEPADEPVETVTVTNGRRRGRRRVMKKKTVKDEEGYLGMLNPFSPWNCADET